LQKQKKKSSQSRLPFVRQSLFRESFFAGRDEPGECLGVVDGDLGEHLAVDLDIALLKPVHETGVGDIVDAASGIDPLNPKLTIVALDETAGIVSVTEGVANLLLRGFEEKMLRAEITFGALKDLLATGTRDGATFNSGHCSIFLLLFDDHELDAFVVSAIKHPSAAELTRLLGGFVRGVVSFVGMDVLDFARTRDLDALHQGTIGFHLRHFEVSSYFFLAATMAE
jgi:hypothetical protein